MNNGVIKRWCVLGTSRDKRMAGDFNSRHEAQAWADQYKGCVVAEVVYDFRNWEPVSEEHPLTQADNGRAVRVDGLEAGVIGDERVNELGVWVKHGECDRFYAKSSITHVARPPKPPRKTIDWVRSGEWLIGTIDGSQVAAAAVIDLNQLVKTVTNIELNIAQPKCVMAVASFENKTYSSTCLTAPIAKEWCERVVNGDEA